MLRQRVRERTSALVLGGRLVTLVLALALVWYGLMLVLLAVKISPATVDSLSGYRTAFHWLAGLRPSDVDGTSTRAIVAGAGVLSFLVFGYLAFKQLPRPYLARRELSLSADEQGEVRVEPRAVERLAEVAAAAHSQVTDARGHYSVDDVSVDVTIRRVRDVAGILREAQTRVTQALEQHGLPMMRVNVTLTGFDRSNRRELQ